MEQCEENSQENDDVIIEKEISKLIEEQRLFTESIYACLPVGIEIYDAHGVLRSINDHALRMYGVDDRTSVVNIVNLYKSPFVTYFISYYHTSDILIYTKALLFAKVNKKVNSFLFVHKDIIFALKTNTKS